MKRSLHNLPRDARLLLAARGASTALESMLIVGLILRVEASGAGPMANAGLMVAMAAPVVVTMRWAGRLADRADSRRILMSAVAVQVIACVVLVTPLAAAPGWALYGACVLFQVGYSFATPVWMALVPRIVGEDGVQRLAGTQMLVASFASPAGAALAGVLVDSVDTQAVPLVSAAILVVVAVLARAIRTRRQVNLDEGGGTSSAAGLAFIWGDRVLAGVLVGSMMAILVVQGVNVVEVFLVRNELGASATQYGLTEISFAAGTALASIIVARLATDRHRVSAIAIGFTTCALACIAVSVVGSFYMYLGLAGVLGLANAIGNGALGPLFLLRTTEAHRGRVMAALNGLFSAASILALFLGGLAGSWLGPRATFLAGGVLALPVIAIMGALTIPTAHRSQNASR